MLAHLFTNYWFHEASIPLSFDAKPYLAYDVGFNSPHLTPTYDLAFRAPVFIHHLPMSSFRDSVGVCCHNRTFFTNGQEINSVDLYRPSRKSKESFKIYEMLVPWSVAQCVILSSYQSSTSARHCGINEQHHALISLRGPLPAIGWHPSRVR